VIPRVIIVGGGFGGLYAARALHGAPVNVTLIDKKNYHPFRPMFYQVATGLLSADEISPPRSTSRDWRAVTIAASARLANRVTVTLHRTPLVASTDTKVSPIPSSNCFQSTLLV